MKRYAFPLTIILLLITVVALAAPGDKRPAVTSAAIGLGTSSSPTLASVTATTSVTAPAFNSSAADGYHYIRPYNSVAFAGTPLAGMFVTTPTGPQWYTGSAWEAIVGASAIADLTDWPSGLTATELGYLDGATSNIQAQINAISVGSPVTTAPTYSDQSCTAGQYAFDASYAYVCRAANTWDRIALGGWSNPSPDTTPDAFAFTDETGIALSTSKTSNAITIAGINSAAAISATGDTGFGYSKNSAACTATSGTVVAGDTVAACVTSSGSNSTATTATVTIGGVSDEYSVTTAAASAATIAEQTTQNEGRDLTTASYLGQSFVPSATKALHSLELNITTASVGATVTCRIHTAINMNASYLEQFSVVDNTSGNHWLSIPSSTHPSLTSGTTYYFACRSDVASGMQAGINTADNYASGIRYYGADWTMSSGNSATSDLTFRVKGQ